MLPPGNTLQDLFSYADEKWTSLFDEAEKWALKNYLAEDLFQVDKTQRRNPSEIRFTESQLLIWMRAVKRIAAHEPLQYVTGKAPFYGLLFDVNPSVLIPRPETEELVELVLQTFPENEPLRVIDFCTGSGCIPITLKLKKNSWQIKATDVSPEALRTAEKNAEKYQADISFFEGDLLTVDGFPKEQVDIIISNPPYIAQKEKAEMDENVLAFEPHLALFVADDDALLFYTRIAEIAREIVTEKGRVFLELNPIYAQECAALFQNLNFDVKLHQDLSGKMRFLECWNR